MEVVMREWLVAHALTCVADRPSMVSTMKAQAVRVSTSRVPPSDLYRQHAFVLSLGYGRGA
jgi:hypothetical protein